MNIEFAQIVRRNPAQHVNHHTHGALEVVYYIGGHGATAIGQTSYKVRKHVFAIIPAGVSHDQDNSSLVSSLCFGLKDSGLEDLQGCHPDNDGAIGRVCQELWDEFREKRTGYESIVSGLALVLVGLINRACRADAPAPRKRELVAKAVSLIEAGEGNLSVADLSEQLFVSRDYLRHLFKEYAGESPMRLIIKKRIDMARRLLAEGECPVNEVAVRCGFDSPYYFSRLFKQVTGQSPSQFRGNRDA